MGDNEIEFSEEAKIEFYRAKCFMEFNGKLDEFWNDFDRQIELIKKFPTAFQIRYRDVRIVSLEKFNFTIHYIIKPEKLLVYRVLNQSQEF